MLKTCKIIILYSVFLLILCPVQSFAYDHGGHGGGHWSGHGGGWGHGYRGSWGFGLSVGWPYYGYGYGYPYGYPYYPYDTGVLVAAPADPTVVTVDPSTVQAIQPTPQVDQPRPQIDQPAIASTTTASADEITINIPNDHGGYTAVLIRKSGNGFTGPQGEFYPQFPPVAQLRLMYGK